MAGGSLITAPAKRGAGVIVREPGGQVLFLQRGGDCDHPYTWCWPGGSYEPGETADQAAMRELNEETGYTPVFTDPAPEIDDRDGFKTLLLDTDSPFEPKLNEEHTDFLWSTPDHPPEPLHPGVRATLDMGLPAMDQSLGSLVCKGRWLGAMDAGKWVEGDHPRGQPGNAGQFGSGGGGGSQPKTGGEKKGNLAEIMAQVKEATAARNTKADALAAAGKAVRLKKPNGQMALVGPDVSKPGGFRVTRIDVDGEPNGHVEYASLKEALVDALREGYSDGTEATQSTAGGSLKPKSEIDKGEHFIEPSKFNAADYAKAHDQAGVTVDDILAHFPSDTADKIRASVDALAARKATAEVHKRNGVYDEQRAELHRKIVIEGVTKKVMDEKTGELVDKHIPGLLSPERVKAATPAKGEAPTFTILGGRGGSGKSWFKGQVYDEDKAIVLDSDHIKGLLPEYEGWNAAQVHEESGELFDTVTAMAKEMGLNIVHDATMKSPEKAVGLVSGFKDKGYKVEAHYMHLPRQEAAKRAVERFLGKTKRLVPPQVILENTRNEEAFEQVRKLADRWSFRDNSAGKGDSPKLISEG